MDAIINLMSKLEISDDPVKLLSDLKITVMAVPPQDFTSASMKRIELFQPLFDFLNSNDKQQITACVGVLSQILTKLEPKIVLLTFKDQILRGFQHPNEDVKILAVKQIYLCCEDKDCLTDILATTPLLNGLCELIGDSDSKVVKYAKKALYAIHSHENVDSSQILSDDQFNILKSVMLTSDSSRFHVYEVVVELSIAKRSSLLHISSFGFLQHLLNEVTGGDVLTQLSALELLSQLAMSQHGFEYLQEAGIVAKLSYLLSTARKDPMAAVILPGVLKFFGHVGAFHVNLLVENQTSGLVEIMRVASDFTNETEASIQLIAFETLSHIGSSVEGKSALQKFNIEMENTIRDLSSHLSSFSMDMKVRFLEAFGALFIFKNTDGCTEDLVNGMQSWFDSLSNSSSFKLLLEMAQKPFAEVSSVALKVMRTVALLPWGVQLMAKEPILIEWILNRSSCMDKESKDARFELVTAIHLNQSTKDHFSADVLKRIEQFYAQGPFYVDAEYVVEVAQR